MHVRLIRTFRFEAAHWLPTFPEGHKCRRMHGHSFVVEIAVEGEVDPTRGYLLDYGDLKAACEPIRQQLDHYCLNDISGLTNPTSEVLAAWIWERLKPALPPLATVVVHETCTSRCEYHGPRPADA